MPVFLNNRPIKRTREILINKNTLITTETDYKHLILIHIPRCAGQTLTAYFTARYGNCRLVGTWDSKELPKPTANTDSVLSRMTGIQSLLMSSPEFDPKTPLQHQPLSVLRSYRGSLNVPLNSVSRIVVCVRNPYDRVISHMFSLGYINIYNTPDEIFTQMLPYLKTPNKCVLPQISYLTDEFGNLTTDARIVRLETLVADMKELGYTDFTGIPWMGRGSWTSARGTLRQPYYEKYLNSDSKDIIYQIFERDFKAFNYSV